MKGSSLSQLDGPFGLAITNDDILYISDVDNHRIVVADLNSIEKNFIIGSGPDAAVDQLNSPYDISTTSTSLYILDAGNSRIQKRSLDGSNPTTVLNYDSSYTPWCFYVDYDGKIYLSDLNLSKKE